MNNKKVLLMVALGSVLAAPARADFGYESDLFSANEVSVDVFGFGASRDKNGGSDNGWGPGVGGNYFFTRNFGLGVDTYADAFDWPYLLNASALFRYPIQESLAPYAFGGFGRQWSHAPQWTAHLGAGIEYRLWVNTGLFADIRGVFADRTKDYTVLRFGFRFKFR